MGKGGFYCWGYVTGDVFKVASGYQIPNTSGSGGMAFPILSQCFQTLGL